MTNNKTIINGIVIEEEIEFTLDELCRACSVKAEMITLLVDEGVIEPVAERNEKWHFSPAYLRRVRTALRLQNDLGLNTAGAALALDLLDEINSLRSRLEALGENMIE